MHDIMNISEAYLCTSILNDISNKFGLSLFLTIIVNHKICLLPYDLDFTY